ncbi:MAG: L-aspartate oxidase [Mycobacterium sp.]
MTATSAACGGSGLWQQRADVVVIGTGVAGLAAALAAHRQGSRVILLSKASETATYYAQGGIAVVIPRTEDSVDAHVADTVAAGGGLCDPDAVRSIVADGYAAVAELVDSGAHFDESIPGQWALTREGGHSRRRIIHAGGDATGAEVQRALDHAAAILDIRRDHVALRLLRDADSITGVLVASPDGLGVVHAASVILATGGLGHLYSATTNPDGSTGDGIALALWAGVPVSDLEFIQFHPTMLFDGHAGGRRPLITEAIRGEGAVLVDARGTAVMTGVHPMGDLAPRDVVAAAIDARLRETGDSCVFLDARHLVGFEHRFPTVTAACLAAGIDPTRQPIPVVPGAHYSCGGVVTDVHGRTELTGLYAAGEVARTGMHGANRLASNSLLEGLVVGGRAGRAAAAHAAASGIRTAPMPTGPAVPTLDRTHLQQAMARDASVVRDGQGLLALGELVRTGRLIEPRTRTQFEDVALTVTAAAVAAAATARTESRGCHHRSDYPDTDEAQARSTVVRFVDGHAVVEKAIVVETAIVEKAMVDTAVAAC